MPEKTLSESVEQLAYIWKHLECVTVFAGSSCAFCPIFLWPTFAKKL